jgi:hypothetical protein
VEARPSELISDHLAFELVRREFRLAYARLVLVGTCCEKPCDRNHNYEPSHSRVTFACLCSAASWPPCRAADVQVGSVPPRHVRSSTKSRNAPWGNPPWRLQFPGIALIRIQQVKVRMSLERL